MPRTFGPIESNEELHADYVIAGAGSAGCVLAARLSEDPNCRVLLIESGGRPRNPWIDIPLGYFKTVGSQTYDWRFETEPEPELEGRRIPWPRGKGLGGTSLINGMLYLHGHRADYDEWAARGAAGWGWTDVLPYFERATGAGRGPAPAFSTAGPLVVSCLPPDPLSDAFIESAERVGIARIDDFNSGDNTGASYFRMTTSKGRRVSTARAYLRDAMTRPNLRVLTGAHAVKVRLRGIRATGLDVLHRGALRQLHADSGVILCAGALQSPQILQLSGIGDARLLASRGIAARVALPGVGRNLQDHLQMRLVFRCEGVETLNDVAHSVRLRARELARYLISRSGALSHGVYRAGAFFRVTGADPRPDVQVHFGLVSFDRPHQPPHRFPGVTLSVCLLRPASRGAVEVSSGDPLAAPRIHAGYLRDPADRALAVSAVERAREIAASLPLARHLAAELEPGPTCVDRASLLTWTRRKAVSIFHPVGTCAMGSDSDPEAVLDHELRVRGVDALRVADGSVMPTIVSGNTNAPIVMIAERAADLLRGRIRAPRPLSGASSEAPARAL